MASMPNQDNSLLNSILMTRKGCSHRATCQICQDLGIIYQYNLTPRMGASMGTWELCECQDKMSRCDGEPPYQYYDASKRAMLNCPTRANRIKLNRIRHFDKNSDIPRRYRGKFLGSLLPDPQNTDLMVAMEQSIEMIGTMQNQGTVKGLYLYGPVGCGKTLLSCAILSEILRVYAIPIKYAKISRGILGKLQHSFNPGSEIYGEGKKIEKELATIEALVIDDFGIQRDSQWVNEVLYDLIDARYENDLLTIFTSNEPMSSWKDISGGRVLSRLKEMCREMSINMPDYRDQVHKDIQKQNLGPWGSP